MLLLHVKHGPHTHTISLPDAACSGAALIEAAAAAAGVFARHAKLIHKGRVVEGGKSCGSQGIVSGARLMLLASAHGTGASETKGQLAARTQSQAKADEAKARVSAAFAAARGAGPAAVGVEEGPTLLRSLPDRRRNWEKTGTVALRDLKLGPELPAPDIFEGLGGCGAPPPRHQQQPQQQQQHRGGGTHAAFSCSSVSGSSRGIRLVDCSHNQLQRLPPSCGALTGLVTLRLGHNRLHSDGIPFALLADACGGTLSVLELDHNPELNALPGQHLRRLTALQRLSCSSCSFASVPDELGSLAALEHLSLDDNNLVELPRSLGCCASLVELSAQGNQIAAIPESLAACSSLQALKLSRNRVSSVPPSLLSCCTQLWLLLLASNPITADQLRATAGYEDFDRRRRQKADKQLEVGVLLDTSAAFSEGADSIQWAHWAPKRK